MAHTHRSFSAEPKADVIRRHLSGKEPVSKFAEKFQLWPTQNYAWANQVLIQAPRIFERSAYQVCAEDSKDSRIRELETKLVQKNEETNELLGANARKKKRNGVNLNKRWITPQYTRPDFRLDHLLGQACRVACDQIVALAGPREA